MWLKVFDLQSIEVRTGCNSTVKVIIAAMNEEEGIGLTIAELQKNLNARIVVVDGHSIDRTVEVAKEFGVNVLSQVGKGKGDAISDALKCIGDEVAYVVLTDADYTYPAEFVPEMIEVLDRNPEVGMVCGNRFNGDVDKRALRSRFYVGNRLIAFAHKVLNGVSLMVSIDWFEGNSCRCPQRLGCRVTWI